MGHPGRQQRQAATQEVLDGHGHMEGGGHDDVSEGGLGIVARVGKKEKQQSLKMVSLLELEILALPAPSPALT